MRWLAYAVAFGLAAGCGAPVDAPTTRRSRSQAAAAPGPYQPPADYVDENHVGMPSERVNRWRWQGARKDCFYVVGNRCFSRREAACKAAGCAAVTDCTLDDSAPVQVTCPDDKRRRRR